MLKSGTVTAHHNDSKQIERHWYGLLPHYENWRLDDNIMDLVVAAGGFFPHIDLFSCVSGANIVKYALFFLSLKNDAYRFNWGLLLMNLWCNSTWTHMG